MLKHWLTALTISCSLLLGSNCVAAQSDAATNNPTVVLHTNKGAITIELYADQAPKTVANFLQYARDGFYDGTIFHRVIKRFMIQGGGFTKDLVKKPVREPIANESDNGLNNDRYTVAMARTDNPDSATSQFFINTRINARLDALGDKPGYTVFGIVTDGRYVVKSIGSVETRKVGRHENVPVQPVIIERVDIKSAPSSQ